MSAIDQLKAHLLLVIANGHDDDYDVIHARAWLELIERIEALEAR